MLKFLRNKTTKVAPHADRTSGSSNGTAPDHLKQKSQNGVAENSTPETSSETPLRDQLSPLFEDNIAAKIIKTAVNGLVDNVSSPFSLNRAASYQC